LRTKALTYCTEEPWQQSFNLFPLTGGEMFLFDVIGYGVVVLVKAK
jgi:hypothetical protein